MYYYGARYYESRVSQWLSVDAPLINGHYLNGNHDGGVYNSFNLGAYMYCRQNPAVLIDPDGNQYDFNAIIHNVRERLVSNSIAVITGGTDATASAATLGIGDLLGFTEHASNFKGSLLVQYYLGRVLADITMISEGSSIAASGASSALAGLGTGPGATVVSTAGATVAAYGAGVALTGTVDLAQSLSALAKLGVNLLAKSSSSSGNGGGKNGQHANQKAKESADQRYKNSKKELDGLKSKPNKTPQDKVTIKKLEGQVKQLQGKKDFTGENHSRNAKGNRK